MAIGLRDIGQVVDAFKKPDGTGIVNQVLGNSLNVGNAIRSTFSNPGRAMDSLIGGKSSVADNPAKTSSNLEKDLTSVIPNPLENMASYTCLWTLACLEPRQFNNPSTYRNSPKDLKHIVFSSAGRYDEQRVQTYYGTPEFFVNNFVMTAVISATEKTGNSNALKFSFDIYEPFSMGLLLQSMEVAAKKAGYVNYLQNAPFVLRLDIQGYNEDGTEYKSIKPKFFTLKLVSCKFNVSESGSLYKVEGIPWNHQGLSDSINVTYTDIAISGSTQKPTSDGAFDPGTVGDVLVTGERSLCKVLNENEKRLADEGKITYPDIYEIQFPEKSDEMVTTNPPKSVQKATTDPKAPAVETIIGTNVLVSTNFGNNPIGQSDFGFTSGSGGNFVSKRNGDVRDEKTGIIKRDQMSIDPKNRTFQFAQAQSLTAIINQIILSSNYAKDALDPKNAKANDGFIKWFRLDVQIQLQEDKFDELIGDYARKIIFRVVPFMVHESIFLTPSAAPSGYSALAKKIVKAYKYIYTGQNLDILKFDININNLFFAGTNPSAESKAGKVADPNQQGPAEETEKKTETGKGDADKKALVSNLGRTRPQRSPELLKKAKGGGGSTSTEKEVAEAFHSAFVKGSSADLISVDLEILGDPYWIVDSGISNYFAKPADKVGSDLSLVTEDGTMNYEGNDVYIYLTFKTPVDINEGNGLYDFPGGAAVDSPFSGIYRVVQCENSFNDGLFKQKLKCIRMPGQPSDYGGEKLTPDPDNKFAIKITQKEKPPTSPQEDTADEEQTGT